MFVTCLPPPPQEWTNYIDHVSEDLHWLVSYGCCFELTYGNFSSPICPPFTQVCVQTCLWHHVRSGKRHQEQGGLGEFILISSEGVFSLVLLETSCRSAARALHTVWKQTDGPLPEHFTVWFQTGNEHSKFIYWYFQRWWLSKVLCMATALLFRK